MSITDIFESKPRPGPLHTDASFDEFDAELNLDRDERNRAQDIHNEITEVLRGVGLITAAFLQGSLARKTMIKPLRDIDKCVILDPGLWPSANVAGGADLIMELLYRELARKYPDATFERSKHALKLSFGDESFTFDIVPSFATPTEDDDVLIADRETGQWTRSNTRTLIRTVQQRNSRTAGQFIHQVRMGKHMVRNLLDGDLPGLHVESLAYAAIAEPLPHPQAMELLLAAGAVLLTGDYAEPTGVEIISKKLTPGVQARAQICFANAAAQAREARQLAEAGDHRSALEHWWGLFGSPFPRPTGQTVDDAFANSFGGGSVTSRGVVSPTVAARQITRPTRSWRDW